MCNTWYLAQKLSKLELTSVFTLFIFEANFHSSAKNPVNVFFFEGAISLKPSIVL